MGGEDVDAPAGTLVFVRPGTVRSAVAGAPQTTVLVIGAPPGEAYAASGWEVWFPAYNRRDYDAAIESLQAALADRPDETRILYNLACCESLAGRTDDALEHLRRAIEIRPELAGLARKDDDFAAIRERPEFESAVAVAGQSDGHGAGA
jgi:tetratricopeptide (TPR) repeat protein